MTNLEIHAVLQQAHDSIVALHGQVDHVPADTAFAVGEALGALAKAKALVGRDIDDERFGKKRERPNG